MIKNIGIEEQVRLWDGCQSYWKFNETSGTFVADSIGGNNAILNAYCTWTTSGKTGNAVVLNNATNKPYITLPYSTITGGYNAWEYNSKWSMSFWIKRIITGQYSYFFVKSKQTSPYAGWRMGINNLDKLYFQWANNSGTAVCYGSCSGGTTLNSTTDWYHIVFTYSGTTGDVSNGKYYVNGVEQTLYANENNVNSKTLATTAAAYIGSIEGLLTNYNFGSIFDEFAIWNRVLREDEVKMLYSNGNGKFYGTKALISSPILIPNLKAWYGNYINNGTLRTPLTGSTNVTQWDDLSGNAFHLDNVSGTTTYEATTKGILLTNGCLYNLNHNIVTGNTARTIFTVAEATNTSTLTDTIHLGLYDGKNHEWAENMRNADYTIASNNGHARYNVTNSNNTKYLFTTTLNGTTIYNNASVRRNGLSLARSSGTNATLSNYVGIIVGGYFGVGTYTPVKRGSGLTVSEIIIYDRLLTNAEIGQVENWLKNKYSLT